MQTLNHSRHEALWGSQGQDIIRNSSVLVVGSDNLAVEVLKSITTLGVENISIVSNERVKKDFFFLDKIIPKGKSKVSGLESCLKECFNSMANIKSYNSLASNSLLTSLDYDLIIDTTNNLTSQNISYNMAKVKNAGLLTIAAGLNHREIDFYNQELRPNANPVIKGYDGLNQGIIISNLFAGMAVEEARKFLFKRNIDKFTEPITRYIERPEEVEQNNNSPFKEIEYKNIVKTDLILKKRIFHDLSAKPFLNRVRKIEDYKIEETPVLYLDNPKILIAGAGSLGNFAGIMLSNMSKGELHFVDFDSFETSNNVRQYLAYDSDKYSIDKRFKTHIIVDKLSKINPNLRLQSIVGYVGSELNESILKKTGLNKSEITLINSDWIAKQNYDAILGCFDRRSARFDLSDFAYETNTPYIDAGSGAEPTNGAIKTFIPGKNKHTLSKDFNFSGFIPDPKKVNQELIDHINTQRSAGRLTNGQEFYVPGQGCGSEYNPGSLSMGNQVAASLMISELRRIINPNIYGDKIVKSVKYSSDLSKRLEVMAWA